jgi:hypothetical protein
MSSPEVDKTAVVTFAEEATLLWAMHVPHVLTVPGPVPAIARVPLGVSSCQ